MIMSVFINHSLEGNHMTGLELILVSTLINFAVNIFMAPDPVPICSVKTFITYDHQSTEVQRPVKCNDLGL